MLSPIAQALLVSAYLVSCSVEACRPRVLAVSEHFNESDSVFLASVVADRIVCFDKEKYEMEVVCDPNRIEVYPSIELLFDTTRPIKGEAMPDRVVVGGCGYGGWSRTGKTLVFATRNGVRFYAYMIPEESEQFKQALIEIEKMKSH